MSGSIVKTPDVVWWNYVFGPSLLVRETAGALCEGKNVCLCLPNSLPWRNAFLEHVADAVREVDESLLFEKMRDTPDNPGKYLVDHFGLGASYRPTKKYADFLRASRAFAGRVLCVTATEDDAVRRWFEFEKDYKPSSVRDGLVLLETPTALPGGVPGHVRVFVYDDFVSEYDTLVFAGLLLPDNRMGVEQKKYLAALAVSLLGTDAENIAEFVKTFRLDRDDPEQSTLGINSPDSPGDLSRRVWGAQVQTLFPLIMREYREFIAEWRANVVDAFEYANSTFPNGLLDTNQDPVESPDSMELATIRYLMRKRRYYGDGETEDYILYIPDESARVRIELLYETRNLIAHGKVCPFEKVVRLLGLEH